MSVSLIRNTIPIWLANELSISDFPSSSHHDEECGVPLPALAALLNEKFGYSFNDLFKLYRLTQNAPAVPLHVDRDFDGFTGSVLLFLSNAYAEGATFFEGVPPIGKPRKGDAIFFPHAVVHGSRPVAWGEKIVLKGDFRK